MYQFRAMLFEALNTGLILRCIAHLPAAGMPCRALSMRFILPCMTDNEDRAAISRRGILRAAGGAALVGAAGGAVGFGAGEATAGGRPLLVIQDGVDYHYLSKSIWVVPAVDENGDPTDPKGNPAPPVAGQPSYVWALVENQGQGDADSVEVSYYWGDPSATLYYSTMTKIGTATTAIKAMNAQNVRCDNLWNVTMVNNGHECLIVKATLPGDPPLPDKVAWTYPNVAQKNLTVYEVPVPPAGLAVGPRITVAAPPAAPVQALLIVSIGGTLPAATLASLGLKQRVAAPAGSVQAGLTLNPPSGGVVGLPDLSVNVAAGQRRLVHVNMKATRALGPKEYQLVNVTQRENGQVVGGVAFVVVGK
jgi:hypothetical protein